jgi:phage FluMu protein gp41
MAVNNRWWHTASEEYSGNSMLKKHVCVVGNIASPPLQR